MYKIRRTERPESLICLISIIPLFLANASTHFSQLNFFCFVNFLSLEFNFNRDGPPCQGKPVTQVHRANKQVRAFSVTNFFIFVLRVTWCVFDGMRSVNLPKEPVDCQETCRVASKETCTNRILKLWLVELLEHYCSLSGRLNSDSIKDEVKLISLAWTTQILVVDKQRVINAHQGDIICLMFNIQMFTFSKTIAIKINARSKVISTLPSPTTTQTKKPTKSLYDHATKKLLK